MILKDTFYTINHMNETDGVLKIAISIHPAHPIFLGHFPGNPITPGVVQMEIIKELLSIHLNRPVKLKSISNCKFLAILNPLSNPEILIKIKFLPTDDGTIKISGTLGADATVFLQMQSVFY